MPNFSVFELKFSIYQILQAAKQGNYLLKSYWNRNSDDLLVSIMRNSYPEVFKAMVRNVRWMVIARELCQRLGDIKEFKTGKQCKERWLNHLSPYLKR